MIENLGFGIIVGVEIFFTSNLKYDALEYYV